MRAPKDIVILVVDDDEMLRSAIVFDFKRKGFHTLEASNGRAAFEIVKKNNVDVILSDVRMPDGDGVELLKQVKELNPNLPVLMFITGFADMTLEDAYDMGADAVFSKPFDRKALLATILRALTDKDEAWSPRQHERVDTDFALQLKTKATLNARALNIGRGGVFVTMTEPFPQIGDAITFCFTLTLDPSRRTVMEPTIAAEGRGVVRWIRTQSINDLPAGYGIEFIELSDACKKQIIQAINAVKTKAFIPKK